MEFGVKKDVTISGRGEEEEGGNPNLGLGFTSDIQLLDAKGKNTSNVNTTAPWDTVTTRTDHGLELSKSLLHGNSGLIYLVQTTHLTHLVFFFFFFVFWGEEGGVGGWVLFLYYFRTFPILLLQQQLQPKIFNQICKHPPHTT